MDAACLCAYLRLGIIVNICGAAMVAALSMSVHVHVPGGSAIEGFSRALQHYCTVHRWRCAATYVAIATNDYADTLLHILQVPRLLLHNTVPGALHRHLPCTDPPHLQCPDNAPQPMGERHRACTLHCVRGHHQMVAGSLPCSTTLVRLDRMPRCSRSPRRQFMLIPMRIG